MPKAATAARNRRSSVSKELPQKVNGKKRAASVALSRDTADEENELHSPPRKRSRASSEVPQGIRTRTRSALSAIAAATNASKKLQLNDLLPATSHPRPARQLFVFGTGDMGQFGLGTGVLGEIARPRLHVWFEEAVKKGVLGGSDAGLEKICAGGMHTMAVDEAGQIWSWGINDNASLGRPTLDVPDPHDPAEFIEPEVLETQPIAIPSLVKEGFRAVDVAAGDSISIAIGSEGELRAWGSFRSSEGLLGFDGVSSKTQIIPRSLGNIDKTNKFVTIACGADHVLALTTTGTVFVWGNGQQAQLGRRIIERRKVQGLHPERLALRRIVCVGSGSYHSFAVNDKGDVYAWGLNSLRQTGVSDDNGGDADIIWTPSIVESLSPARLGGGRRVVQISGGEHHTLFLLSDGSVWGCGRCDGSELGLAEDHPAMMALEERKKEAASAVQDQDLQTVTDSGDPPVIDEYIPEPVPILFPPPPTSHEPDPPVPFFTTDAYTGPLMNPMSYISAGSRFNLVVSRSGHVYSFGCGASCELGLGPDVEIQKVPTRVKSKDLDEIQDGARWFVESTHAGGQHCFLLARRVKQDTDIVMG